MNYTELKDAIEAYTNNTDVDFIAEIPVFVRQAEQRIYNSVQIANLRRNMTGNLQAGNKYIPCPFDFLSAYSLAIYAAPSTTATGTTGQFTIVVSSASDISIGMYAYGDNIGTGAVVTLIVGTTVTLSVANTGTVAGTVAFQGDYIYLLNRDVNYIREAYPNPLQRATPKYYAIFGPNINNVDEVQVVSIIEYNIALVPTATRWNGNVRRVLMYVLVIIILRLLLQWHY